jgi:hypothetical protein
MRHIITAAIAMICVWLWDQDAVQGQPPPKAYSVGLTNQTNFNVLVKGYTLVNGTPRPGLLVQMKKSGGKGFEVNVPSGIRYYTVYDANQPDRILLRDHPVPIQNRDIFLDIVPVPGNPNRVLIVPAGPGPPVFPGP